LAEPLNTEGKSKNRGERCPCKFLLGIERNLSDNQDEQRVEVRSKSKREGRSLLTFVKTEGAQGGKESPVVT